MNVFMTSFTHSTGWQSPFPDTDSEQTLVLVFGDPDITPYQPALEQLRKHYPRAIMAGCATTAAINNDELLEDGLVVGVLQFQHTRLRRYLTELTGKSAEASQQTGDDIAKALKAPDLRAILILTDGLYTNGSALAAGINRELGDEITVIGGLASDHMAFEKTWLLQDSIPAQRLVCAIGFYGENIAIHGVARDGWRPFGPERMITRSEENTLYEIDGVPALALYKDYLGDKVDQLPGIALHYPLAIWRQDKSSYVVRTILGIDEASQSMTFAGDIPQDCHAQLMYGSLDNLVDGAESAVEALDQQLDLHEPVLTLAISCAGRKLVMQEDTEQELEAILDNLPTGSQQLGFYSFGEIAPHSSGLGCGLHNETMTLTVIHERS